MLRYETLFLTVPEITADEASKMEAEFERIVKKAGGSVRSHERWGKYRLSYPVRKNDYGVYFLSRFEVEQKDLAQLMNEIKTMCSVKFPQIVMRHMVSVLDPNGPLEYHKPESLEDIPSQDVDTFLRENKMEGLLKKSSTAEVSAPAQEKVEETTAEEVAVESSEEPAKDDSDTQ